MYKKTKYLINKMDLQLDELHRQNLINKLYVELDIYNNRQYDKAKIIASNKNISFLYKKHLINIVYNNTIKKNNRIIRLFQKKYNILNKY